MPILHAQILGQAPDPSGQMVPVLPSQAIQQKGPVVQVTIGPLQQLVQQWTQQGISVPASITGEALIDTGASVTCIDDAVAQQLGLPVIDVMQMVSASHTTQQNVYPVSITIATNLRFDLSRVMGANLQPQGLAVLIGRDLLSICTLHYNGTSGEFTLAL